MSFPPKKLVEVIALSPQSRMRDTCLLRASQKKAMIFPKGTEIQMTYRAMHNVTGGEAVKPFKM
jgi:hypothetical protein